MAERHGSASLAAMLYVCSFVSGVAALGYEVVWTKSLSLTFGATRLAAGAVLAGFMGGLGLGARAFPFFLARAGSPLRAYALLEAGIAATAVLLTLALPRLSALFGPLADATGGGAALVAVRFVFALLLLLVPCALMGATFPALSVTLIRTRGTLARHLGLLYGLNTLGAALGALLSGIFLIEALGLRGSAIVCATLNLAIAAGVALRARRGTSEVGATPDVESTALPTHLSRGISGAVLVGSGFATLAYEIVWFRALTYLFGNSTYAFTTMLFVFLVGLGTGPMFFRRIAQRGDPERVLALAQLGIGVLATFAIGAIAAVVGSSELQQRVSIFFMDFHRRPWQERLLVDSGVALVTILPATVLMGVVFPLATRLFLGDVRRLGPGLGTAVLLSNGGSIAGALAAAIVLLPVFGTIGATRVIAVLNLALGALVLRQVPGRARQRGSFAAGAVVAAIVLAAALPDRIHFTVASASAEVPELVFEEEGDLATVQVWRDQAHPEHLGMAIDGTAIGATRDWDSALWPKQVLLAHLPFALDGRVRDVLTIGLGSASTLEGMLAHPGVRRADVVEINAPVVAGCRFFPASSALSDPRVTLVVDDALYYLQRTPRRYDTIVSDGKQAMSFAGTAKLLSREHYALCRDRLTEDGLFVQWAPLAIGNDEFAMIVRTLGDVFEHVDLFLEWPSHLIFVASQAPIAGRPRPLLRFDSPQASADLDALRIPTLDALRARWVADRPSLEAAVGPGPTNTWDRPHLEFLAYKQDPAHSGAEIRMVLAAIERASRLASASPEAGDFSQGPTAQALRLLRMSLLERGAGRRERAATLARLALAIAPSDPSVMYWERWLAHGGEAGAREAMVAFP